MQAILELLEFLHDQVPGQAVDEDGLEFAHDERAGIVDIGVGDAAAVLGDVFIRHRLLDVGDVVDVVKVDLAKIGILADPLEDGHEGGLAFRGRLRGGAAGGKCLIDVGQGRDVGSCALQGGELDRAGDRKSVV